MDSPFPDRPGHESGQDVEPPSDQHASEAQRRFLACRWRKAAENGTPDHCSHRDVLPMAGTTGFTADAWCGECGYFKARRTPRKREMREQDPWY